MKSSNRFMLFLPDQITAAAKEKTDMKLQVVFLLIFFFSIAAQPFILPLQMKKKTSVLLN